MSPGLSLANKCQLLFGLAIVVLLAGVLAVPWFRSETVISDAQIQIGRKLAESRETNASPLEQSIRSLDVNAIDSNSDPFFRQALRVFTENPEQNDLHLILTKLILSPVRELRETTEMVEQGQIEARSEIITGDDFEQLSNAFNRMLDELARSQFRLTSMNENLDFKVNELAEANIGLHESNRLKSEFLANISHELKTPLNSIIGFAELLEELAQESGSPDDKQLRYLANIVGSGRSLLEMINELLQMAKIEAGRVEVAVEPTSISDLLEGLQTIMRPQAEAKSIDLSMRIPPGLPAVETDAGKLQQILFNFLSNAIRFSDQKGGIVIAVHRVSRQEDAPGIRISVTDEGPGVPYDMQDAIFEKFRQVDASHTRAHSETGPGLAICRELASLLGATVSLVSEPGHGATFSVEIPSAWQNEDLQPLMESPRRAK